MEITLGTVNGIRSARRSCDTTLYICSTHYPSNTASAHHDAKAPPHHLILHSRHSRIWPKRHHFVSPAWDESQARKTPQGADCSASTFDSRFRFGLAFLMLFQDTLSSSLEIGVGIAIASCATRPCFPPQDFMGDVLFHGAYKPVRVENSLTLFQNFSVEIPSGFPKGHAQLNVAHSALIGVRTARALPVCSSD